MERSEVCEIPVESLANDVFRLVSKRFEDVEFTWGYNKEFDVYKIYASNVSSSWLQMCRCYAEGAIDLVLHADYELRPTLGACEECGKPKSEHCCKPPTLASNRFPNEKLSDADVEKAVTAFNKAGFVITPLTQPNVKHPIQLVDDIRERMRYYQ